MAFPVVAATNTSTVDTVTTSHTVALPAGIASGDLLIVLFATENLTLTWPSGWTSFLDVNNGGKLAAAYRVANGSEGASISVTTNFGWKSAHTSYRISGYQGVPEATTATGSSSSPNPPSLTPAWGQAETLWLVACAGQALSAPTVESYPTNYTNGINSVGGGSDADFSLGSARRSLDAAAEDPVAFTLSGSVQWVAATIGIRPVTASGAEATPAGQSATATAGAVGATGGAVASLTGQAATSSAGTATAAGGAQIALTGVSAAGSTGTVGVESDDLVVPLTGLSATVSTGSVNVSAGAVVAITGHSATAQVGNVSAAEVTPESEVRVVGNQATAGAGTVEILIRNRRIGARTGSAVDTASRLGGRTVVSISAGGNRVVTSSPGGGTTIKAA